MKIDWHDAHKAKTWAREHWHVAIFGLAVLGLVTLALVSFHVLSERAGWAAFLASVVFVIWTTWDYTRPGKEDPPAPPQEQQ